MEFSLLELRVLSGLASGKTLAAIGEGLYLGEPSISKALRSAEQKAGFSLVSLRGRRLSLTPAGEAVAHAAASVLDRYDELTSLVNVTRAGQGGPLHLVATPTPANYVLPAVLGEFQRAYPDAQIHLQMRPASEVPAALLGEDHDFAIGPRRLQGGGLQAEWLYDDPVIFVAAAESAAAKEPALLGATAGMTLIGPFVEEHWAALFDELKRQGITVSRKVDLRAVEAVKQLVAAGEGIGVLLGSCVRAEIATGSLRAVPLVSPSLHQSFYLVRRESAVLTPLAASFRDLLLSQLRPTLADVE